MGYLTKFWEMADRVLVWLSWGVRGVSLFGLLPPAWTENIGSVVILLGGAAVILCLWAFFYYDEAPGDLQMGIQAVVCGVNLAFPFDPPGPLDEVVVAFLTLVGALKFFDPRRRRGTTEAGSDE